MGKLSKKDIKHVASLAKLKLSKKEVEKFREQLSEVISYVEELNKVNTKKVKPTSQTTGLENATRKDKLKADDCLFQKQALSGTDKTKNGYFVVPAVFEERTDE